MSLTEKQQLDSPPKNRIKLSPEAPWLGLRSFDEASRNYFHGRSDETTELAGRIQQRRLTVLYGKSGLGKSSLIKAGVAPRLKGQGARVVYIRLIFDRESLPLAQQVVVEIVEQLSLGGPEDELDGVGLWELLHDPKFGLVSDQPDQPAVILMFDQFEEVHTLGESRRPAEANHFMNVLSAITENRPSDEVLLQLESDDELAERLVLNDNPVKILFSLRDDYLHWLERWRPQMPSLMENRLELLPLLGPKAMKVVMMPAEKRCRHNSDLKPIVNLATAEAIVRFVAGVEPTVPIARISNVPPLLNLVCEQLNATRLDEGKDCIDEAAVSGQAKSVLRDFYSKCFVGFQQQVQCFVEDELLSESGFRESLTVSSAEIRMDKRGIIEPKQVLKSLINERLLTVDDRNGTSRVELTHDILVPVAIELRQHRLDEESALTAQQEALTLQQKAAARLQRRLKWIIAAAVVLALLLGAASLFVIQRAETFEKLAESRKNELAIANDLKLAKTAQLQSASRARLSAGLSIMAGVLQDSRTQDVDISEVPSRFLGMTRMQECIGYWIGALRLDPSNPEASNLIQTFLSSRTASDFNIWPTEDWGIPPTANAELSPIGNCCVYSMNPRELVVAGFEMDSVSLLHDETILSMKFSHGGKWLLSGTKDESVFVWDTATGKKLKQIENPGNLISYAASEIDERMIIVTETPSGERLGCIWNTANWQKVRTISNCQQPITESCIFDGGFVLLRKLSGNLFTPPRKSDEFLLEIQSWSGSDEPVIHPVKGLGMGGKLLAHPSSCRGYWIYGENSLLIDFSLRTFKEFNFEIPLPISKGKRNVLLSPATSKLIVIEEKPPCGSDYNVFNCSFLGEASLEKGRAKPIWELLNILVNPKGEIPLSSNGEFLFIENKSAIEVWGMQTGEKRQMFPKISAFRDISFDPNKTDIVILELDNRIQRIKWAKPQSTLKITTSALDPFSYGESHDKPIKLTYSPGANEIVAEGGSTAETLSFNSALQLKSKRSSKVNIQKCRIATVDKKERLQWINDSGETIHESALEGINNQVAFSARNGSVYIFRENELQRWNEKTFEPYHKCYSVNAMRRIEQVEFDPLANRFLVSHRVPASCGEESNRQIDLVDGSTNRKTKTYLCDNLAWVKFINRKNTVAILQSSNLNTALWLENIQSGLPSSEVVVFDKNDSVNEDAVVWANDKVIFASNGNLKAIALPSFTKNIDQQSSKVSDETVAWLEHLVGFKFDSDQGLARIPDEQRVQHLATAVPLPAPWNEIQNRVVEWPLGHQVASAPKALPEPTKIQVIRDYFQPYLPIGDSASDLPPELTDLAKSMFKLNHSAGNEVATLPAPTDSDSLRPVLDSNTSPRSKGSLGLEFVKIMPGDFVAGRRETLEQLKSDFGDSLVVNNEKQRAVKIDQPFFISTTEVSYNQFRMFTQENNNFKTQAERGKIAGSATGVSLTDGGTWKSPSPKWKVQDEHPVSYVTYNDAVAFCDWLSKKEGRRYRLPTDDEWEYAARAGSTTRFWNGDDSSELAKVANIPDQSLVKLSAAGFSEVNEGVAWVDADDGFPYMAPVASFPSNPWGLHDVHGNVFEWCTISDPSSVSLKQGVDPGKVAVIRGGCLY